MFHTIVFSGGANHAAVFIGCIRYLEHTCLLQHVRRVVGSSAGSFIALMLALGLTSEQMRKWTFELVREHAFNKVSIENALDMCDTLGIDPGHTLDHAVKATLGRFLGSNAPDPTFKDLAQATGMDLTVCALNVTMRRYEYFSVDTTPAMSVRTAIRMSMSVPIMFTPVLHDGCLYVDPVLGRNFPYDFPGAAANDTSVLGLSVKGSSFKTPAQDDDESMSLLAYIVALMAVLVDQSNEHRHRHSYTMVDILVDPSIAKFSMSTMEFAWTQDLVAQLCKIGYNETQRVLQGKLRIA